MRIEIEYTNGNKIMASPRPRAASRPGGFGRIYMPKSYMLHKAWLARQIKEQIEASEVTCYFAKEQALRVELLFEFAMPKSWSKVQKQRRAGYPKISKPDVDNLEKTVLDAMSGLVWHDDSQIADLSSSKRYTSNNNDKLTILIREID